MKRLMASAGALAVLLLAACGGATGTGTSGTGTTGTAGMGVTGTGRLPRARLLQAPARPTVTGTTTVTGRFLIEGGPMRPGRRPAGGAAAPGHGHLHRHRRADGQRPGGPLRLLLGRPGARHLPRFRPFAEIMEVSSGGAQHETVCSQPLTVHVTGQHALKIAVTCIVP